MDKIFQTKKAQLIMKLRSLGIYNQKVLSAIELVPRELFVLTHFGSIHMKTHLFR